MQRQLVRQNWISIHALREEGDPVVTPRDRSRLKISIHALREEGDGGRGQHDPEPLDFYPRPPRGGRPVNDLIEVITYCKFLSTPSARRATCPAHL